MSATQRILLLSIGAFLMYGGWALYANYEHGWAVALRSGAAQGAYSFVSTVVVTMIIERTFAWAQRARVAIASITSATVMSAVVVGLHIGVGTPNLLLTVAPSIALGSLYCVTYSLGLSRVAKSIAT